MLFYYFLHIFPSDFADFACFLSVFRVVCRLSSSPIQELEPDATPSVVGVALFAILTDCQQLKKNTLIMIMQVPTEGVEPSQRPCRARDGAFS
jgi:hypothetical protein